MSSIELIIEGSHKKVISISLLFSLECLDEILLFEIQIVHSEVVNKTHHGLAIVCFNWLMPLFNCWSDPLGSCRVKGGKLILNAIENYGCICWINVKQSWESLVEATNLNFEILSSLYEIFVKSVQGLLWCENLLLDIEDGIAANGGDLIYNLGLELWVPNIQDVTLVRLFLVI